MYFWSSIHKSTCKFTPPNSEIICGQNVSTKVVCGIIFFFEKKAMLKIWKKSWVPFRSYLLNSTANPAHLHSNWAGLATFVLTFWPHIISELDGVDSDKSFLKFITKFILCNFFVQTLFKKKFPQKNIKKKCPQNRLVIPLDQQFSVKQVFALWNWDSF